MKKFLVFLLIVFLVVAVVAGAGWYFFYSNGIAVFVETFDHGYLTVDSKNIEGTDDKYRIDARLGETLNFRIIPQRDNKSYYVLDELTVNGVDVTDQVSMLQYRTTVYKKMTITATFKKGTRPVKKDAQAADQHVKAPTIKTPNQTAYLGSLAAYNIKDPSVIYDESSATYYAFGSENVVVQSKDLINWTGKTTYFETVATDDATLVLNFDQFNCVKKWAKQHGYRKDARYSTEQNNRAVLAPDIIYTKGTYYLYFSISKSENANESAIFCVSTQDLATAIKTKTWNECGLVICSCGCNAGEAPAPDDEKLEKAQYDASNCVHPSVFFGADNKMYMAYGGYYGEDEKDGGIYLLELNKQTGLLKKNSAINAQGAPLGCLHGDAGYHTGVVLAKPGDVSGSETDARNIVSAPELFYEKKQGYYYLLTTYGIREKNQSIRIARAQELTGPFVDLSGFSMADNGKSSKDQYEKGTVLYAGYNFDMSNGGKAAYSNAGKASPGSPCVFRTATGKWMLADQAQIYYKVGTALVAGEAEAARAELTVDAAPSMEVRRVLWTKTGWPMVLPEMYAGEGSSTFTVSKLMTGHWDVITMAPESGADLSAFTCNHSQIMSILADRAITQKNLEKKTKLEKLSFRKDGKGGFLVLIDGTEYTVYTAFAWDWELSESTLTFVGYGADGSTVWGKKSYSPFIGTYTDAFRGLLDRLPEQTQRIYEAQAREFGEAPTQSEIDTLTEEIMEMVLAQE